MDNSSLNNPVKAALIESYQNGDSWYRVYSDGFIEQGGISIGIGANWTTVNLIKPFVNTNYNFVACLAGGDGVINAKSVAVQTNNRTVTTWNGNSRYYNGAGDGVPFIWRACGY